MALSGSTSVAFTNYDTLKFSWSATQSVANNSSTVSWKLELISGKYGEIISSASKAYTIVVDGNTYTGTNNIAIGNNATKTLVSGSTLVKHDSEGRKTFNYSFTQAIKIKFNGVDIGTKNGSGSGVLNDIPRYATLVNAPDFRQTTIPQIMYNNPLGAGIEGLKMCIAFDEAGSNIAVAWQSVPEDDTYYTVSITEAERQKLAQAVVGSTSVPIYYILSSTIGGVAQQSKLKRTYNIEGAKPSISYTVSDSNTATSALTGNSAKFIKFYSDLSYSINAQGMEYATITGVSATYRGTTKTTATGSFNDVDTDTITFTATDNRGQTTTKPVPLDVVPYVKLSCDLSASNPTATGTMALKITGNYFSGSFGAQNNALTVQYRLKKGTGSYGSWITVTGAYVSGNTYEASTTATGLDYQSSYTVQARALDKVATGGTNSVEIRVKSIPTFDWGESDFNLNVPLHMNGSTVLRATDEGRVVLSADGDNIHLRPNGSTIDEGQMVIYTDGSVDVTGLLDVSGGAVFNDDVSVYGVLNVGDYQLADYVIDYGDNGSYAYRKWYSGKMEAWRTATSSVSTSFNMAYGSMYYNNTIATLTTNGDASQFKTVQDVQITLMANAGMPSANIRGIAIENGAVKISYYMANPVNTTLNITPKVHIIGTWQ